MIFLNINTTNTKENLTLIRYFQKRAKKKNIYNVYILFETIFTSEFKYYGICDKGITLETFNEVQLKMLNF